MDLVEPDADGVLSGLFDDVRDVARSVLAVVEIHLGLIAQWVTFQLGGLFSMVAFGLVQASTDSNGSRNPFFGPETFRKLTERSPVRKVLCFSAYFCWEGQRGK